MNNGTDLDLVDFIDIIDKTLSDSFVSKWRYKYGERIIRLFQVKILNSLKKQKPIKLKSLIDFLSTDSGFNENLVQNFLTDVEIELYYPVVLKR